MSLVRRGGVYLQTPPWRTILLIGGGDYLLLRLGTMLVVIAVAAVASKAVQGP